MRWGRFYLAQLKRTLRQPFSLLFMLLAILLSLYLTAEAAARTKTQLPVGLVLEDDGEMVRRFIELVSMQEAMTIHVLTREAALAALQRDQLEAVFIVTSGFSQSLAAGQYRFIIERYTAPTAQYTAPLSEPVLAGTMILWTEQALFQRTRAAFSALGRDYTPAIAAWHQAESEAIWRQGSGIRVRRLVYPADPAAGEKAPPSAGSRQTGRTEGNGPGAFDAFSHMIGWYAALSVFYLASAPVWILDIQRRSLRERAIQQHIATGKLVLMASLAPLTVCLAGYLLAGTAGAFFLEIRWQQVFILLPAMLLYLAGIIGLTLVMAAGTRQSLVFLFAAPLITFVHAVLSGLLLPLPEWAALLRDVSRVLPGRQLTTLLASGPWTPHGRIAAYLFSGLFPLLLCCLAWLGLGILLNGRKQLRHP